jgi:hypothetical protein
MHYAGDSSYKRHKRHKRHNGTSVVGWTVSSDEPSQSAMEAPKPPKVFVDANILIRGITFPRYPYEVLRPAAQHTITLVVSASVLTDARHYLAALLRIICPSLTLS